MNNSSAISWFLIFSVLACLVVADEVRSDQSETAPPATITIRGSDAFIGFTEMWVTAFGEQSEALAFDLVATKSSEGIRDLIDGRTDIAMASRRIKAENLAIAGQKGVKLRETIVAQTGISVIVNPSNTVSSLTLEQIGNVFAGTVRNWHELGGPDEPIVVVQKTSGSSPRLFREQVLGERDFFADSVAVDSKDAVVVEVGKRPWSIGFTGLEHALTGLGTVNLVLLQRDDSNEGSTYALKRPFFFYTIEGNPVVQPFLDFVTGNEGQAMVVAPGFFPAS